MRFAAIVSALIVASFIAAVPAAVSAQDDPLELLCTDNEAKLNGAPWGPGTIKIRITFASNRVELLDEDGRMVKQDRGAVITDRTIKWGRGIYGLNTIPKSASYNITEFEGTIDREAGTAWLFWENPKGNMFRGRCRVSTRKF